MRKLIFAQTRFVAPFAVPHNIAPDGKDPVLTGRVFLPSFVGAAPRHPIMRDFVSRMLDWYEGGQPNPTPTPNPSPNSDPSPNPNPNPNPNNPNPNSSPNPNPTLTLT